MPDFVIDRLMKVLNKYKKPLNGSKILLLGVAYKKDIDDLRESPSLDLIDNLNEENAEIIYNDPFIPEFEWNGNKYKSVELDDEIIKEADAVLIATNHSAYDIKNIVEKANIVFDTRNATKGIKADNIYKL